MRKPLRFLVGLIPCYPRDPWFGIPLLLDALNGVDSLRRVTAKTIKVTLPSAHVFLRRFYSPEHSARAYPRREDFLHAVEGILVEEAREVLAAGAECIQLPEWQQPDSGR